MVPDIREVVRGVFERDSSQEAANQKIAVVTDSCADVPADTALKLGIRVVPLHINYLNESFRDRVDIQPMLRIRLCRKHLVKTIQRLVNQPLL